MVLSQRDIACILANAVHILVRDRRPWVIASVAIRTTSMEFHNTSEDALVSTTNCDLMNAVGLRANVIAWGGPGYYVHAHLISFQQVDWIVLDPFFLTYMAKRYPDTQAGDALAKLDRVYGKQAQYGFVSPEALQFPKKMYYWPRLLIRTIPFPCVLCGSFPSQTCKRCKECEQVHYCGRDCQKQHWSQEHKGNCNRLSITEGTKRMMAFDGFEMAIRHFLDTHDLVFPDSHAIAMIQGDIQRNIQHAQEERVRASGMH